MIYKKGSYGTTFYIILKGSVSIIKKEFLQNDEEAKSPKKFKKAKSLRKKKTFSDNEDYDMIENEVKILEKGQSFGELALIENKPRAATLICKENSHFATLEKTYFDQILSNFSLFIESFFIFFLILYE